MELYQMIDKLLERTSNIIREKKENILGKEFVNNITYGQYKILYWISILDKPTITVLAEKMCISKPSMTIHIQNLEKKGLVKKEQSNSDRRSYVILLADNALKIENAEQLAFKQIAAEIHENLDEKEYFEFKGMLEKILKL